MLLANGTEVAGLPNAGAIRGAPPVNGDVAYEDGDGFWRSIS